MTEESKTERWLPIEFNPEMMYKFLHNCGLPTDKWAISVFYGLDAALLSILPHHVVSLTLLFPINEKYEEYCRKQEADLIGSTQKIPKDLYFMKQTISNACGTVAMIHAVANNLEHIQLEEGSFLKNFFEETVNKTPEERALALESDDGICAIHDQVAQESQTNPKTPNLEDGDVGCVRLCKLCYHYVTFVENGGHMFELDGRKSSAINLGQTTKQTFLLDAIKQCQKYMKRESEDLCSWRNVVVVALYARENE